MAAQYTEVSLDDMDKFLKRAFRVYRPKQGVSGHEYSYELTLSHNVGIRILTSIHVRSGTGREVGADTIKAGLISLKDKGPLDKGKWNLVNGAAIKRTQGWRTNLQDLIEGLIEKYDNKEDFYEPWAEFRKVPSRSEPQQSHPINQDDQPPEIEREEEIETPTTPPPSTQQEEAPKLTNPSFRPGQIPTKYHNTQFRLSDAPGSVSPKQLSALKRMMHKVNGSEWQRLKLDEATNFVESPKDLSILSKLQASAAIDILKPIHGWNDGGGGGGGYSYRRYAGEAAEADPESNFQEDDL